MAAAVCLLAAFAPRAVADPVQVSGVYGSQVFSFSTSPPLTSARLTLTFPDFAVSISEDSPSALALSPGFDVPSNGSPVPFTQATGTFSMHSVASPGSGIVDADVTGHLAFVGPIGTVNIGECDEADCEQTLIEPITWTAFLTIREGGHVFFSGPLHGTGTGFGNYSTFPPGQLWNSSVYTFSSVAETPEPASILLLGTGVAWLAGRRRRGAGRERAASRHST